MRDHRSSFEVLVALRRLPAFLTVTYGALWVRIRISLGDIRNTSQTYYIAMERACCIDYESKGTEKEFRAKWSEDGGEVRAKRYLYAFTGETEAKTKAK